MNDRINSSLNPSLNPYSSLILHPLITSIRQHRLDALLISIGDEPINVQVTLTLSSLLSQNVARVRMAALDLSGRGKAKTLGRTFMSFKFWHNYPFFNFRFWISDRRTD